MQALIQGLRALGPVRLAAMGVVGAAVLGLLVMLAVTSGRPPTALLYGGLDLNDAAQATEQLSHQHIPFQLGAGGTAIMVPADLVPQARLALAKAGLPSGGSVGYELFDRGAGGLTSTDFEQQIAQTRALEGELARSIRAIAGVRGARVHLVLPRREPFAHEQQSARASVLLTMAGATRLDREGVQAILNLVAAAVPGLKPRDIAIVDSRGELLARAGSPVDAVGGGALSGDEMRRATELRVARAVEEMLERSLGPGHVRAEAAVRMDYDQVRETQERYDPDGQVPRSEQSVTTASKNTEAAQTVSVQNNLPNAEPASSGAGSEENRQEQTTNYEISKTVRTLIHEQPQIGRISLAVMVDSAKTHSDADLARIGDLVRTAIGFDAKRGDEVKVEAMPFVAEDVPEPAKPSLLGMHVEKSDVMRLAEIALFGLIGVVALLTVLRPMVARLTTLAPAPLPDGGSSLLAGAVDAGTGAARQVMSGHAAATPLDAPSVPALLEDESMVSLAQVEGQMRASSIRRVADLVERHPEDTLNVVRGWISREAG
ncbi:MAG TPA: flagellar basal-body MS-ring/collar protein FliF [Acetobacteraceae bacterium]|nr:flagellar basal-body MS-ring/collar protein FliF [Acetobacteraceae bacterium]